MKKRIITAAVFICAALIIAFIVIRLSDGKSADLIDSNSESMSTETENMETEIIKPEKTEQGGSDLEEIVFSQNNLSATLKGDNLIISNTAAYVIYDIKAGTASFMNMDFIKSSVSTTEFTGAYAEAVLDDGTAVRSDEMKRADNCITSEVIKDGFGTGVKVSVLSENDKLTLVQNFYMYEGIEYILFDVAVKSDGNIRTNYISPLTAEKGDYNKPVLNMAGAADPRFLFVPFDNDAFVRYSAMPLMAAYESYEVTTVYDNTTRKGFVIGSVTHDTWKTGIRVKQGAGNSIIDFRVFGGITSKQTRDTLPHGYVSGQSVSSPKIFLGFYDDYRDGMEEYGRANAVIAPPLEWDAGTPFGWNSWSAVADKVSYDIYVNSSDFVKEYLQDNSFSNDGIAYINFDSFWDNLTEAQLKDAARHVKENGQIPGIYYTPFTFWGGGHTSGAVEGTNKRYTYQDIVLKDEKGTILPAFDGGVSIDPTHPASIMRLQYQFDKFREWGFEYVKLDFMSHGSVEGSFYNKDITTGIQAYNYGMQQLLNILKDEIEKQEFFISLSIAPIFPSQYAHSRRISCDVFGTIDNAEYMLNSLTYGWWMNDTIYKFNDPDHIVVYNSYNHLDKILYNEGLTRYVSSAISGTMLIDSDDFRIAEARERAAEILTNEEINKLARDNITFRPVEGNTKDRACDTFIRLDEDEGTMYLAVFNFSSSEKKNMTVLLERLGLDADKQYKMKNLIIGVEEEIQTEIKLRLDKAEPRIFKIYLN